MSAYDDFAAWRRRESERLRRAVAAGEIDSADAEDALAEAERTEAVFATAAARDRTRVHDRQHTRAGLERLRGLDGKKAREQCGATTAKIAGVEAGHAEYEARAPFLRRLPDGGFRDLRSTRPVSDEAERLQERRDQRLLDNLLSLDDPKGEGRPKCEALVEREADRGDPDGVVDFVLRRAPSYLQLIGKETREKVIKAVVRQQGLDTLLARSKFKRDAYRRLGGAIEQALDALGDPAPRPGPLRVLADGSVEQLAPIAAPAEGEAV